MVDIASAVYGFIIDSHRLKGRNSPDVINKTISTEYDGIDVYLVDGNGFVRVNFVVTEPAASVVPDDVSAAVQTGCDGLVDTVTTVVDAINIALKQFPKKNPKQVESKLVYHMVTRDREAQDIVFYTVVSV